VKELKGRGHALVANRKRKGKTATGIKKGNRKAIHGVKLRFGSTAIQWHLGGVKNQANATEGKIKFWQGEKEKGKAQNVDLGFCAKGTAAGKKNRYQITGRGKEEPLGEEQNIEERRGERVGL